MKVISLTKKKMIPPICCMNCGKLISKACLNYQELLQKDKIKSKDYLDKLNLKRYCCRSAVMSYSDISQDLPFGRGM